MEKKNIILIAIVALIIVLAAVALMFNGSDSSDLNSTVSNITNNTTDKDMGDVVNFVDEIKNSTSDSSDAKSDINSSANVSSDKNGEDISPSNAGWKWSEQAQGYVNEYVDAEGDLHVKSTDGNGPVDDLVYKADGSVYLNGKDVTKEYNNDFN